MSCTYSVQNWGSSVSHLSMSSTSSGVGARKPLSSTIMGSGTSSIVGAAGTACACGTMLVGRTRARSTRSARCCGKIGRADRMRLRGRRAGRWRFRRPYAWLLGRCRRLSLPRLDALPNAGGTAIVSSLEPSQSSVFFWEQVETLIFLRLNGKVNIAGDRTGFLAPASRCLRRLVLSPSAARLAGGCCAWSCTVWTAFAIFRRVFVDDATSPGTRTFSAPPLAGSRDWLRLGQRLRWLRWGWWLCPSTSS